MALVAHKTAGDLNRRARGLAVVLWPWLFLMTCVSLVATYFVRPDLLDNYRHHPVGYLIPAVVFVALGAMLYFAPKGHMKTAFVASCVYLGGMLVGAAYALYPVLLPARDPERSLTIWNAAAGRHGLVVGLAWWTLAAVLAVLYFVFVYRMFRGKVNVESSGPGH
jgi:cytochrome bd ubiquinol oxidase subunit II